MSLRLLLCMLFAWACFAGHAQAKTPTKARTSYIKLLEAYTQRTLAGRRGIRPVTDTHFIVIWEGLKYPKSFFWRGDTGVVSCSVVKAHKVPGRRTNFPQGADYTTEHISADMIHKGDTLQLTPAATTAISSPNRIPTKTKNTLFFKTGNSGWLAFPVKNITRKQDLSMP
jgi:hypothetical protein